jgi:hypothetical protein
LGDAIQFARYLPLLADLGARVVFELPAVLSGLLQGMPGVSEFVVKGQALPAADFHCPLLSLPLAFETTHESIPSPGPYLEADPQKVKHWYGVAIRSTVTTITAAFRLNYCCLSYPSDLTG